MLNKNEENIKNLLVILFFNFKAKESLSIAYAYFGNGVLCCRHITKLSRKEIEFLILELLLGTVYTSSPL